MDISVVIVSYRVKGYLRRCLESVLKAGSDKKIEIIVVDNNSCDGTTDMLAMYYPEVRLIANNTNPGFAVACNMGIAQTTGRYLLILNPDTVIPQNTFKCCSEFMENHPDAGIVGVRLVDGRGRFLPESKRGIPTPFAAFCRFSGLFRLFPRSSGINRYYMGHRGEHEISEVEAVTGAFMFAERETMFRAGLFDERYFMFGEDIDLCMQVGKTGNKIYYCPNVTVTHFKGKSGAMLTYSGLSQFYYSMHLFIEKNLAGNYILPIRAMFHAGVLIVTIMSFVIRTPGIMANKLFARKRT